MQGKSVKLTIIKIIYAILVFVIAIFVISRLSGDDNADMTAQMSEATLPTVSFLSNYKEINPLHGYTDEMDISHLRGTILPIGSNRDVTFKIRTYGRNITNLRFEVRNIDGVGLVENTNLQDYKESADAITGSFQLKDLITSGKEYMLVMLMDTESGTARYYSRIVWTGDESRYHMDDEIDFVRNFSNATFDKEIASEYSKYLESNSEGDNTSFNKVNIHSSFNQVTWGDLDITEHTEPDIYVTDIHGQTGSFYLQYRVNIKEGAVNKSYNVCEAYRVRYTSDRIYLLNFERTMNYIFDTNAFSITKNVIGLSISDPELQLVESSSGSAFAFVSENRLYMLNNSENKLAYLFGFYDDKNDDIRTRWDRNTIKILRVDEAGNVKFAVAGYMNRGAHEGQVGIAVYDYNASINAVEEQAFIKSTSDPQILMEYVETIVYANTSDVFYVMLDQNIYAIDLNDRTWTMVVDGIGAGEYKISESMSTIAWQSDDLKSLKMMNLGTKTISEVAADDGDFIRVLGFMGEDMVFGLAHESDVLMDQMGNPVYAMYNIKIQDGDGNILENYHPEGIYVTDVSISDNQIRMTRVVKEEESGKYVSTYDDQIMSTLKAESGSNVVSVVSVDIYEKIVQIAAKSEIKTKQIRVLTPAQTLFEGDRNVVIESERDQSEKPFYYVYGLMGLNGVYSDPADAVNVAYAAPAVVVGDDNRYVWYKGNLLRSNQIMSITRTAENYENMTSEDPVAVCLNLILTFEGVNRNVQTLLQAGEGAGQILASSLPDARILDLDGCPMSAMLYYVNQDIPVMAMMNDGSAVLIIGFNDLNTVLMNPETGTVYKYGMNDSEKLFEENGNHFITYITEED
ncbi:hypothetical protein [Butyrivibrio sp. INlla14]|uniref:hypothetical protein n=1 Tax=Butyrivibrio sp. INlla14 TaxID=1520808 RepID=UPI0008760FC7|nr:hypothetical protein [Butyrivibrio sp. INlla14]SCY48946.1 hypothetical protein SAMN02910371_02489 [Butyrivibrio sp. INlla14]